MDDVLLDLPALDRDVRRAAERLERARAGLETPEGRARARASDPFEGLRHVAGQTTWRGVSALEASPNRDALLRWIHELLQARIGWDLEVDEADARSLVDERLAKRVAGDGSGPAPTFDDAWAALLLADPRAQALDRVAALAAPVTAARRERRARRLEASHRLGLAHPMALASTLPVDTIETLARGLLDATEALAKDVLREAEKKLERASGKWRAEDAVHLALAKDAREGWPAKLSARWLGEAFAPLAPRGAASITPRRLPPALGASSFLVGAARWGAALRASLAPRSLAFALAHDPYPTMDLRFGFGLAIVVAEPAFQRRVLGLPARLAATQARALRVSLLLGARMTAARFLLAAASRDDAFEELTHRVFGAPLPEALAGAWPEPCPSEPSRLLATASAWAFVLRLRERFDEDWFANPRAGAHLAQIGCAPAWDLDAPEATAPAAIGRAFEEALG